MRLWRWARDRRTSVIVDLGTLLAVAAVYVVVVLGGGMLLGQHRLPERRALGARHRPRRARASSRCASTLEPVVTAGLEHGRRSPYDVLSGFTGLVMADRARTPDSRRGRPAARLARHLADGNRRLLGAGLAGGRRRAECAASWPPRRRIRTDATAPTRRTCQSHDVVARRRAPRDPAGARARRRAVRADRGTLFADLAAQAGMVLHRTRLRAELARRAADLAVTGGRAPGVPATPRRHPRRRASSPRARHPRRRPAAPGRPRGQPPPRPDAGRHGLPSAPSTVLAEQVTAVDAAIATLVDLARGSTRERSSSRVSARRCARSWARPGPDHGPRPRSRPAPGESRPRCTSPPSRPCRTPSSTPARRPRSPSTSSSDGLQAAPGGPRRRRRVRTRGRLPGARARQHARPDRLRCVVRSRWSPAPGHGATVLATVPSSAVGGGIVTCRPLRLAWVLAVASMAFIVADTAIVAGSLGCSRHESVGIHGWPLVNARRWRVRCPGRRHRRLRSTSADRLVAQRRRRHHLRLHGRRVLRPVGALRGWPGADAASPSCVARSRRCPEAPLPWPGSR